MAKIGEFVYPWGGGHYTRMSRLNEALRRRLPGAEVHAASGPPVYGRLRGGPGGAGLRLHEVAMPVPVGGAAGPSLPRSLLNVLLPVAGRPPLVRQVASYLREERRIYDSERFDLVISDGDMGTNVLARNRGVPCLFVTNQFRPRLWRSRAYLYPALLFVARQIAKASEILVADSAPPWTMCEYNLNFPAGVEGKVRYVGHFAGRRAERGAATDLERLVGGADYGYWMRTGDRAANEWTGRRYAEALALPELAGERRVISHARADPSVDAVTGRDGRRYGISEAYERGVDWAQVDVGFLSDQERDSVLGGCRYAVLNGSHTAMGEAMGVMSRPVVVMPVHDEHTNHGRWAEERGLGVLARSARQAAAGIARIRAGYEGFEGALAGFSASFDGGGAEAAAGAAAAALGGKE